MANKRSLSAETWLLAVENCLARWSPIAHTPGVSYIAITRSHAIQTGCVVYMVALFVSFYGSLVSIVSIFLSDRSAQPLQHIITPEATGLVAPKKPKPSTLMEPSHHDHHKSHADSSMFLNTAKSAKGAPRCQVRALLSLISPSVITSTKRPCCPIVNKMSAVLPPLRKSSAISVPTSQVSCSPLSTSTSLSVADSFFPSTCSTSMTCSPRSSACSWLSQEQTARELSDYGTNMLDKKACSSNKEQTKSPRGSSASSSPKAATTELLKTDSVMHSANSGSLHLLHAEPETFHEETTFPAEYVSFKSSGTFPLIPRSQSEEMRPSLMTKSQSESKMGSRKRFWRRGPSLKGMSTVHTQSPKPGTLCDGSPGSTSIQSGPTWLAKSRSASFKSLSIGSSMRGGGKKSRGEVASPPTGAGDSCPEYATYAIATAPSTPYKSGLIIPKQRQRRRTIWGGRGDVPMDWRDDGQYMVPTPRRPSRSADSNPQSPRLSSTCSDHHITEIKNNEQYKMRRISIDAT